MAKIAHKFETQSSLTPAQQEPPVKHIPQVKQPVWQSQAPEVKPPVVLEPIVRESAMASPVPEPPASSPPPIVAAPVPQTQQYITHSQERWNDELAEAVEQVEHGAWREVDEEEDAWKDEEDTGYAQENTNLETVAEETGTGLVAVALYDYQAAAEDELSFDPDDVIMNIEMVIKYLILCSYTHFYWRTFLLCRSMKAGGVENVEARSDYFPPITSNCNSETPTVFSSSRFYPAIQGSFCSQLLSMLSKIFLIS